MNFFCRNWKN